LDAFWRATDLTPQMIADPETRVSPAQFCVAWAEALRLSGDPALALTIADSIPQGAFGIVEYICRSAPTLRDGLAQWVRYLGILDDAVEVALVDVSSTEGAQLALRVVVESEAPAPASHELCFALVLLNAQRMIKMKLQPVTVRFSHSIPQKQIARYCTFFEGKVEFGAKRTELVFSKNDADAKLTTADPNLLAILVPAADKKREHTVKDPPLTDQVKRALSHALSNDDAQLSGVAKRLGMTARSLQRRLQDEGISFQTLRDETRRTLADRYLGEGLSLAEISFLLGFSEPSAFFRAFKRWTGLTPIERRASLPRAAQIG
ncbi:MAG: AraC family transcriptional regulator, partial [Polyangiaceae bacterium]